LNLNEWLEYLERCHPSTIELGLERINQVASRLPIDFSDIRVITVGGTNGKGSTVTMLSAILEAAGYRTACYTSPHLVRYNERVRLGQHLATDEELCHSFAAVEALRGDISLTYFEFGTLAALQLFSEYKPDVAIFEVGLGGRLDAVNILDPDIAMVTNVALDHMDWLGDTREAIGAEKAGIFRTGKPAICGEAGIPDTVTDHARKIGATLYVNGQTFQASQTGDATWHWQGTGGQGQPVTHSSLPLNDYPLDNCAAVLQAITLLAPEIDDKAIAHGLTHAVLPGRFQHIDRGYPLILDVGHNPHAASRVKSQVMMRYPDHKVVMVVAILVDKDYRTVMSIYQDLALSWYVAGIQEERGLPGKILYNCLSESGAEDVQCYETIHTAFAAAEQACQTRHAAGEKVLLLVTGSFFTVSAVMEML